MQIVKLGPELSAGTLPAAPRGRGWVQARKQGAPVPQRPPTPLPSLGKLLPVALKWPSLRGWESGLGRTLLTRGPGAGGQALWASGFLGFLRDGGRQGRSLSGPGGGALIPQTIITEEHPSLFFSEVLVPPTVAYVLGPSES